MRARPKSLEIAASLLEIARQKGRSPHVVGVFVTRRATKQNLAQQILLTRSQSGLSLPALAMREGEIATDAVRRLRDQLGMHVTHSTTQVYGMYDPERPRYLQRPGDQQTSLHPMCHIVERRAAGHPGKPRGQLATAEWPTLSRAAVLLAANQDGQTIALHAEILSYLTHIPVVDTNAPLQPPPQPA